MGLGIGEVRAPELATNQARGGVIQGLGYALYEERRVDPLMGRVLTAGLEDYRVAGIGDIPEIEVKFASSGFEHVPGGSVGMGEVSTIPCAGSVANAVFNATGWRPKELPIRPDRVMAGLSSVGTGPSWTANGGGA